MSKLQHDVDGWVSVDALLSAAVDEENDAAARYVPVIAEPIQRVVRAPSPQDPAALEARERLHDDIEDLYRSGLPMDQVAHRLHVSVTRVSKVCRERGVPVRSRAAYGKGNLDKPTGWHMQRQAEWEAQQRAEHV